MYKIVFILLLFLLIPSIARGDPFLLSYYDQDHPSNYRIKGFMQSGKVYEVFYLNSYKNNTHASMAEVVSLAKKRIEELKPQELILFGDLLTQYFKENIYVCGTYQKGIKGSVAKITFDIPNLIESMGLFPKTYYVLFDDSYESRHNLAFVTGLPVKVTNSKELWKFLIAAGNEPFSVLVINLFKVKDLDLGGYLSLKEIYDRVKRNNPRHLEISFYYYASRDYGIALSIGQDPMELGWVVNSVIKTGENITPKTYLSVNSLRMSVLGLREAYKKASNKYDSIYEE